MKTLTTLFVISLISFRGNCQTSWRTPISSDFSNARLGDCGPQVPRDRLFPNIPLDPRLPRLPNFPYNLRDPLPITIQDTGLKFRYENTETVYSVTFRSQNPNPPSCKAIARRLKNHADRISELAVFSQKISTGEQLSFKEIRSFLKTSKKNRPELLDAIDQTVELNITWKFPYQKSDSDYIFYFLNDSLEDFKNYIIEGPGLRWTQTTDGIPPFFSIVFDRDVTLTYEMQMMDFCFGDNHISVRGKFAEDFGPRDPILKATWERDLHKVNQTGSWTIKTAAQLQNTEVYD